MKFWNVETLGLVCIGFTKLSFSFPAFFFLQNTLTYCVKASKKTETLFFFFFREIVLAMQSDVLLPYV